MEIEQINRIKAAIRNSRVELRVLEEDRRSLLVSTPFMMPDGDHIGFNIRPAVEIDGWMLTDYGDLINNCLFIRGHTSRAPDSYRKKIEKVLTEYRAFHPVNLVGDALVLEVEDDHLESALAHFTQILLHTAHVCSFGADSELNRQF